MFDKLLLFDVTVLSPPELGFLIPCFNSLDCCDYKTYQLTIKYAVYIHINWFYLFILHSCTVHFYKLQLLMRNYRILYYYKYCSVTTVSTNLHRLINLLYRHRQYPFVYKHNRQRANLYCRLAQNLVHEVTILT